MNDTYSDDMLIEYVVPQGTILGSFLIIVYMNDIFNVLNKNDLIAFANDTAIIVVSDSW